MIPNSNIELPVLLPHSIEKKNGVLTILLVVFVHVSIEDSTSTRGDAVHIRQPSNHVLHFR